MLTWLNGCWVRAGFYLGKQRESSFRFTKAHMDASEVTIWKESHEQGKNVVVTA